MKHLIDPRFRIYFIGILGVFIATLVSRTLALPFFLPYYSIDENEIIEFAVAYLCGDWDPHWYKYGPLYSYILAVIYSIFSFFSNGSLEDYIQDIFFNPKKFYLTARVLNVIINLLIAWFTYRLAYHVFSNRRRSIIVFLITIFPFLDIITAFKPRVDTILALFVIFSLIQLVLLYKTNKARHYILLGLFVGFSLASKPLPALLIMPVILLVVPFAKYREKKLVPYWQKNKIIYPVKGHSNLPELVKNGFTSFLNYKVILLIFFIVAGNFLTNPYSILNFNEYFEAQTTAITEEGGRDFIKGWNISRFFNSLGVAFVSIGAIAFLSWTYSSFRKKKYESLFLIMYAVIFWLSFSFGAARDYFYIPILPVIIISISYLFGELSLKVSSSYRPVVVMTMAVIVFIEPSAKRIRSDFKLVFDKNTYQKHTLSEAHRFISGNIDPKNKFMLIGPTPNLPRVLFRDVGLYTASERDGRKSALFGDYFMYGRGKNANWVRLFAKVHNEEVSNISKNNFVMETGDFYKGELKPATIYDKVEREEFDYIITAYDYSGNAYFDNQLLEKFDEPEYRHGNSLFIYDVQKGYVFENPKSATDHIILGKIAQSSGDNTLAQYHYKKSLEIDSSDSIIFNELGTLEFNNQNYQNAYNYFDKGSRLDSAAFNFVFNKGLCMMQMQQYQSAVQIFDTAEKLDQNQAQLYLRRGICYINLRNTIQGCNDFMKASEINAREAENYIYQYCQNR